MANFLASGAEFLNTAWGLTLFILLDIVILLVVVALNYRWLFKRVLDILFSAVFMAVFLPFFLVFLLVDALYNKSQNAYKTLFISDYFAGKKGKVIRLTVFATERMERGEDGKLLPVRERITPWGKFMKACGMKYYPCLPAIFFGKLSFVGPAPMTLTDAAALSEEGEVRFSVRPGLISSLERFGGASLTWPDMFEEDAEYVSHISLARDAAIFMTKIAHRLRGDVTQWLGVCAETGYVEWLAQTGAITEEESRGYAEAGSEKLHAAARTESDRRDFERRDFGQFR